MTLALMKLTAGLGCAGLQSTETGSNGDMCFRVIRKVPSWQMILKLASIEVNTRKDRTKAVKGSYRYDAAYTRK